MSGAINPSVAKVRSLLDPENVAIVGASERPGSWSKRVAASLRRCGFRGAVYPVNPRAAMVWGETCWPDLASLPQPPDHLAILVPGAAAVSSLEQGAKAGARSATIFSSGFGEGGDSDGRALAERLRKVIEETGLAVSGPNCLGNIAAPFGFATITDERVDALAQGKVAIVGQSGGIVMALFRALRGRGVQPGYAITSGNEIGLTTADYIRFFAQDENTQAIACFIESIRKPDDFRRACAEARDRGKPIVAVKIGGSEASRAAALAHTGALAGSLASFDAATRALGVVRVDTLDDLIETLEFFVHSQPPRGQRLGAMTFSGGLKGLMLESAERNGLCFPALDSRTIDALRALMGVGTSIGNPLDAGFSALSSADAYFDFVRIMLGDPNIDALMVQEELPYAEGQNRKAGNLRKVDAIAIEMGKPIAVVSMASYMYSEYTRAFRQSFPNLPVLHEVDKALRAVAAAGRYGALRSRPVAAPRRSRYSSEVGAILARAHTARDGRRILDEAASKALFALYGIESPREIVASNAEEAAQAARSLGFPVVLKLVSPDVQHKSDVGGVRIGLTSEAAVRDGFAQIERNLLKSRPEARFDGVLVAPLVSGGVELVLGVQRDPEVGPVVMIGAGGVLLELAKDVSFGPTPLDAMRAEEMISEIKAAKLLAGYRGAPAADRSAATKALIALSDLADDLRDAIESVDINPFVALPRGGLALDGLVVLRPVRND